MTGQLEFDMPKEKSAIIKVIGVGGAGGNAINHMFQKGIKGVNYIIANTDEQHLNLSPINTKLQLGPELTGGLGTGADPEIGRKAAEESIPALKDVLGHGTKMLFLAAGMGKGTGTGGSPVIARVAKEMGILTVAVVTSPFSALGKRNVQKAQEGIDNLKENVDALIIVANDKILEMYGDLSSNDAFALADDILTNAVKGIAEIITGAGIQNTDFTDVKNVLSDGGMTLMSIGHASGEHRGVEAVNNALNSPLLGDYDITGAEKALINIKYSSAYSPKMSEIGIILDAVNDAAGTDVDIIYGTSVDDTLEDELAVTLVMTGFSKGIETKKEKASAKEIISVDTNEKIESKNEIIVVEDDKQILIDFGGSTSNDLFYNEENYELEKEEDIVISEAEEASFMDDMGRMVVESESEKRIRMMNNLSFDVNSPLNSMDNLSFDLPNIGNQSNMMITGNENIFKLDNRFDTKAD